MKDNEVEFFEKLMDRMDKMVEKLVQAGIDERENERKFILAVFKAGMEAGKNSKND